MVDYAKIELPAAVGARLLLDPALAFIGRYDRSTGAVLGDEPCVAEYGPPVAIGRDNLGSNPRCALQFKIYPSGRAILHGSFHKYAQGGANWGDFTFAEFAATVAELCRTFNLDPFSLRLLQLEAGANVHPPVRTVRTLGAIICHREGQPFVPMRSKGGRSLGLVMERDQYDVKAYDKGRQFALPFELLRFELKFTKAVQFQRLNIHTVNDLLNPEAWQRLEERVLGIFDELVIAEPSIDLPSLTEPQRSFATLARTPSYWQELTKGARYKARARYADIVQRFAGNDLKAGLRRTLAAKLNDLLNVPSQNSERGDHFTKIPAGLRDNAGRPFHDSVKVGIGPPEQGRRCRTCGRDISDQRRGSKYCSEARFGNEGKRCRNAGSNPRNNRLRSLWRIERDPLLFDHRPYIAR